MVIKDDERMDEDDKHESSRRGHDCEKESRQHVRDRQQHALLCRLHLDQRLVHLPPTTMIWSTARTKTTAAMEGTREGTAVAASVTLMKRFGWLGGLARGER